MRRALPLVAVTAVLLLLPVLVHSDVILTVLIFAFLLGMVAVSFNLIFGFAGQLSMFHAAAFGIGAYATHLAMKYLSVSFWAGALLAAVCVALLSVLVGALCFRFKLREFYFAVVTLAFSEVARLVVINWDSVTNGSLGITLEAKPWLWIPNLGLMKVDATLPWYYLSLAGLGLSVLVCWRIVNSWMGRCLAAIRLNDELGDSLGVNVFRYKLAAFVTGNAIAAVAGALYAYYLGFIEPGFLSIDQSLAIIAMVLLGGRARVWYPVVGALVLTALPHLIHFSAEVRSIVYGLILILTILFMPNGIMGSVLARFGHGRPIA